MMRDEYQPKKNKKTTLHKNYKLTCMSCCLVGDQSSKMFLVVGHQVCSLLKLPTQSLSSFTGLASFLATPLLPWRYVLSHSHAGSPILDPSSVIRLREGGSGSSLASYIGPLIM